MYLVTWHSILIINYDDKMIASRIFFSDWSICTIECIYSFSLFGVDKFTLGDILAKINRYKHLHFNNKFEL